MKKTEILARIDSQVNKNMAYHIYPNSINEYTKILYAIQINIIKNLEKIVKEAINNLG